MNNRFEVLDSFRGIFALCVVGHHIHVAGAFTQISFFRGSSFFVEFFFVLSGFVLAHAFAFNKEVSFKKFFVGRTFRIFPLHIAMLFAFIGLELGRYFAVKSGIALNNPPFTGRWATEEIIPNLLLIHALTPFTEASSFNSVSWSISVEYYMYLLFFIILMIVKSVNGKLILWTFLSSGTFYLLATESNLLVISLKRGLACFFLGALTYWVYLKLKLLEIDHKTATLVEAFLCIAVIFAISYDFRFKYVVISLLFSLGVFIFAFEAGIVSSFFKNEVFLRLGELSYSIYMTHVLVISLFISITLLIQKFTGKNFNVMYGNERFFSMDNLLLNNFVALLLFAASILLAIYTHKYIEKPFIQMGKNIIKI